MHPHTNAARQAKLDRADALGIDKQFISTLVETFYARIRDDAMLGPIFAERITDWPSHLARMKAFWSAVLRGGGGYTGTPMPKHIAIPNIGDAEFSRWLALFDQTLRDIEQDPGATALTSRQAHVIAESLLTGIRIHRDGVLPVQRGGSAE
ncbi:MAG TPA: group III truncated hemoglobin [Novosphingobium sp.]|nr:group III truncated hemoglobin [Novosphingobium sp.]HQA16858.1 group III truncated hemoglobin [Novosphingobium sp.]